VTADSQAKKADLVTDDSLTKESLRYEKGVTILTSWTLI